MANSSDRSWTCADCFPRTVFQTQMINFAPISNKRTLTPKLFELQLNLIFWSVFYVWCVGLVVFCNCLKSPLRLSCLTCAILAVTCVSFPCVVRKLAGLCYSKLACFGFKQKPFALQDSSHYVFEQKTFCNMRKGTPILIIDEMSCLLYSIVVGEWFCLVMFSFFFLDP